ncbi:MAG TPA: Yip1 family protein [Caulobacter sp.]|nr:Yip1 family protein [Caulobacter sp.]
MSVVDGGGSSSGLAQRVQDILLRPAPTWEAIDAEPATVKGLYQGYVMVLAAIGPVCGFLGGLLFHSFIFAPFTLVAALAGYVLGLAGVYVMALVIDGLAPSFGGTSNRIQAFKVAAYSGTAAWVAGVFQLVPMLSFLGIVGLYSLYLLYVGLPRLMKVSADKAMVYTLVVVVLMIVIYAVIAMVVSMITLMGAAGAIGAAAIGAAAYN